MSAELKKNIPWRSNFFIGLRIVELGLAITVFARVIPEDGFSNLLHKRSALPEPRRGGGGSSESDDYGETASSASEFLTFARFATPYYAFAMSILTVIWCITALAMYYSRTLRPKISMTWDIVFTALWLGCIICAAIGMSETGVWEYSHYSSGAYAIFGISLTLLLLFIWSLFNSRSAHRELSGKTEEVKADYTPVQSQDAVTHTPSTVPVQSQFAPVAYPQGYYSPSAPQYNTPTSYYAPPAAASAQQQTYNNQYQPPVAWGSGHGS